MSKIYWPKLDIVFFKSARGIEPVREWLKSLTKAEKYIIGADLKTVQYGWPIGMPLVRHIGEGIWEVRISLDHRIARILFFMHSNSMILVNGFIKKSQKTPQDEINLAKKRMKQFESE